MIVHKVGKKLFADFECRLCGCEYTAPLNDCNIIEKQAQPSMLMDYRLYAFKKCPCCGLGNTCNNDRFHEYINYAALAVELAKEEHSHESE